MTPEMWSALVGALVGGVISGVASWGAVRYQVTKANADARADELDRRIAAIHSEVARYVWLLKVDDRAVHDLSAEHSVLWEQCLMLEALARGDRPGLAAVMKQFNHEVGRDGVRDWLFLGLLVFLEEYLADPRTSDALAARDPAHVLTMGRPDATS